MGPKAFIRLGKSLVEPTENAWINQALWTSADSRPGAAARNSKKGGPLGPPFLVRSSRPYASRTLRLQDVHDLERTRIHHHDLVADHEELITAPFRIDGHDFARQRDEVNAVARNPGADREREVDIGHRGDVLVADDGRDLGPLLGRELGAGAGLANRGVGFAAALRVHVATLAAFTALGLHVLALALGLRILLVFAALAPGVLLILAALALGILLVFAAFLLRALLVLAAGLAFRGLVGVAVLAVLGLHLARRALGLVLRAHALRLLTGGAFFSALALAAGWRLLGLHARRAALAALVFRCCTATGAAAS